jgi:O-antigen biosynthesis protein
LTRETLIERAPQRARESARPGATVPTVSVVICAYTARRWEALTEAVASVQAQTQPPLETIVVVDHNPELLERAAAGFRHVTVVANAGARGLSGARNTGVAQASGDVVAFLDDDARADPEWLAELTGCYEDPAVVGAGGVVEPRWHQGEARDWLPAEFFWTIGCSYTGLPSEVTPIRNPIGANMSFRRDAIQRAGGFREGVGRLDATPLGCEETELAVRVSNALPGTTILHVPRARVDHLVEPDRSCWPYFRSRCWSEGISKAIVARHVGRDAGLASERSYATRTLPRGVITGIADALRGDLGGLTRAAVILAGLAITAAGYAWGWSTRSAGAALEGEG